MRRASVRSRQERDALILQFVPLTYYVYSHLEHLPKVKHLGKADAIQIGFLHLIRAAELWEEDRGVSFKSYAYKSILAGILQATNSKTYHQPPATSSSELAIPLEECLKDESRDRQAVQELYIEGIMDAVHLLPPRIRRIILDTSMYDLTYEEVGRKFGITRERVRQLRNKALTWLRAYLENKHPRKLVDSSDASDTSTTGASVTIDAIKDPEE